jgi:hypothetical protein
VVYDGRVHRILLDNKIVVNRKTAFNTARSAFLVGRRNEEQNQNMNGAIDDVRIYNRALSESEIKAIYESQSGALGQQ